MLNIMDCTLRDGGWVNKFRFGTENMRKICKGMREAGVRYIELGYLDKKAGSESERSMYSSVKAIEDAFGDIGKSDEVVRLIMIDYGKFDHDALPDYNSNSCFDGIRLCFHKKNMTQAIEYGRRILEKGYKLFFQPMVTSRYSDEDLLEMIDIVSSKLPTISAFYIVDSFGVMDEEESIKRLSLADSALDKSIMLGFHTHNNRGLSFGNAKAVCENIKDRNLLLDCTLSGFGKGPGNLVTEEFADYLNQTYGKNYNMDIIRSLSEEIIAPYKEQYRWGYDPQYEITSNYRATPTYAKVFCEEYNFSLEDLEDFLIGIPEDKKDSFDRKYAEEYIEKLLTSQE